ncbi:hypothetical protein A0H81_13000 [Grifola frondosa]|uniref:Uncharacterized protein n=1 Tax=Grifola frondosa TaxID=5627 RepID=A0A1C7LR13_GRIFR|nr:hypothetical protein A0H81_13000 [Grifola frondosa]
MIPHIIDNTYIPTISTHIDHTPIAPDEEWVAVPVTEATSVPAPVNIAINDAPTSIDSTARAEPTLCSNAPVVASLVSNVPVTDAVHPFPATIVTAITDAGDVVGTGSPSVVGTTHPPGLTSLTTNVPAPANDRPARVYGQQPVMTPTYPTALAGVIMQGDTAATPVVVHNPGYLPEGTMTYGYQSISIVGHA